MIWLKRLLIFLSFIVMTLLAVFLILWTKPQWILRPKVLQSLQERLAPEAKIPWEKLMIDVSADSWKRKTFHLQVKPDFCFDYAGVQGCLQKLDLQVQLFLFDLLSPKPKKFNIQSSTLQIALSTSSQSENSFNFQSYIATGKQYLDLYLQNDPQNFNFDLQQVKILSERDVIDFSLQFDHSHLSVNLPPSGKTLSLDSQLSYPNRGTMNWDGILKWADGSVAFSNRLTTEKTQKLTFELQSLKPSPLQKVQLSLNLDVYDQHSVANIEKWNMATQYGSFKFAEKECQIRFESTVEDNTKVSCKGIEIYNISTDKMVQSQSSRSLLKKMPVKFFLNLSGSFTEAVYFSLKEGRFAQADLHLVDSLESAAKVNLQGKVSFAKKQQVLIWDLEQLKGRLDLSPFSQWAEVLRNSPWAVPAPLNALDGSLELELKKEVSTEEEKDVLQIVSLLNLSGDHQQALKFDMKSHLYLRENLLEPPRLMVIEINLAKFHFYLPNIDPLRGLPPVTGDERLERKKPTGKELGTQIRFRLDSANKQPIKLFYQFFEPFFSTNLQLSFENDRLSLRSTLGEDMTIEYLKRQVVLQKLDLKKDPLVEDFQVDGRLLYTAAGYRVFIDFAGNLEKPQITLSSDPALSREDIISLLIYKRTATDLDPRENQNVGNTQAALKDRALGLFGIWVFASTPVESVYYDSATQRYSAQIALPGEFQLSVGTDWENMQMVGLRKRISKNWSLVTAYETGDEKQIGNIFLQRIFSY